LDLSAKGDQEVVKAMWNDVVIAEAAETDVVEGNHYFPPESVRREYLKDGAHTTT